MEFNQLGLSLALLDAVEQQGYTKPSPIQEKAIPIVLKQQDLMAAAQTGTGKTAAFVLPILELLSTKEPVSANQTRVLILAPTRELAQQISDNIVGYGQNLPLRSTVVYGGVKINPQMIKLRKGVDILVATPGRLLDLHQQNAIKFNELEILVLDEADRMLDMGFIHDLRRIINLLPKKRQNLLFSATFSSSIRELAKTIVNHPVEVSVTPENTTAKTVKQWIHPVDKKQKTRLLIHLIRTKQWHQVLVFCRTKHGANRLVRDLETEKLKAVAIHGNKSQNARLKALHNFKQGQVQILVATDIAARGIDIQQLPYVVNFDLPHVPEDYVHRIGRTGRAGMDGRAISLVSADEVQQLCDIERLTQKLLERVIVEGFDPVHTLPVSVLRSPFKQKKPKKMKNEHHDGNRSQNASAHQIKQKKNNANRRRNTEQNKSVKKFRIKARVNKA
ncbi:MAG: DEAD/DEAH box helicase [Gammaproteobacteria bacterium]|nr:DEAD/DEAH box helicase [Gammaproteobacteria bacterium]